MSSMSFGRVLVDFELDTLTNLSNRITMCLKNMHTTKRAKLLSPNLNIKVNWISSIARTVTKKITN